MIKVLDSIMGSGKTSWAIEEMNAHPEQRYLYVTPYLAEAERIRLSCPSLNFALPTEEISKSASLQMLVEDGRNVAISHALFTRMKLSPALYTSLRQGGYTLIMDEEVEIIEPVSITKQDTQMLFAQGLIEADEAGRVRWIDVNYKGRFAFLKRMAESRTLVWFQDVLFLWVFPVEI